MAHNEPSHLNLHCLPILSLGKLFFFFNFAGINFVFCFFFCALKVKMNYDNIIVR